MCCDSASVLSLKKRSGELHDGQTRAEMDIKPSGVSSNDHVGNEDIENEIEMHVQTSTSKKDAATTSIITLVYNGAKVCELL